MKFRKLLFWCHLLVGCTAGAVILIMCVTGVLLAFERQILAGSQAGVRVAAGPRLPLAQLAGLMNDDGPAPSVTLRADATAPLEVSYGRERTVFVDPMNGRVLGEASREWRGFFAKVERMHRSLGSELRAGPGRPVTGACNLAFLFLVMSGFYLWFPKQWTRQHFRPGVWFRSGLRARGRELNWHKVVGVWSAVPLFFVVLTGVIMSYAWANNLLYRLTGTEAPPPQAGPPRGGHKETRGARQKQPASNYRSLDELLESAQQEAPGWKSISFRWPQASERSVTFSLDKGNGGQPQKKTQVTLNRASGAIERQEGFATYNAGRKLRTIARFLHTGEILGIPGQLGAAAGSAGGAFLVYTGFALALRRLAGWRRRRARLSYGVAIEQGEAIASEARGR